MSNELDLAIRSLREAAPQVTSAVGAFGSVSALVLAGALAYSAMALRKKDDPYTYDMPIFILGVFAIGFGIGGFICLFGSLPGLFSPEGRALYSLIR